MALPAEKEQPGKVIPWRQRAGMMGGQQRPNGAVTGKAQMLDNAILRLHLSGRAQDFLRLLNAGTYHKGGFHIQDGTPEHWCPFNLATWAEGLGMKKPHVCRMRDLLLSLHVIQIQDGNDGATWIGWNLNTDEWQSPARHGGPRSGAGRPKNQDGNAPEIIQDGNNNFQDGNNTHFKMVTTKGDEARPAEDSDGSLRNVTKKLSRDKDANASTGAVAPDTMPSPSRKSAQKRQVAIPSEDDPAYKVALYLHHAIAQYAPEATIPEDTPKDLARWTKDARALLYKRAPPDIKLVIDFVSGESFWQAHILSVGKLKDKFDTLLVQAKRGQTNGQRQSYPVSAHPQTSRRGAVAASNQQRQSRPGDDE